MGPFGSPDAPFHRHAVPTVESLFAIRKGSDEATQSPKLPSERPNLFKQSLGSASQEDRGGFGNSEASTVGLPRL